MADLKGKFRRRANSSFERAAEEMQPDVLDMMGTHSAKGRLQSGATIIAALQIFEDHSSRALSQVLSEAAKLIEHRGRQWEAAMDGIKEALGEHISSASAHMEKPRSVADSKNTPSITSAIEERLVEIDLKLRRQFNEFREGWTAPSVKPWKERHPLSYAVALLLIGALIGVVVPVLLNLVKQATG